MSFRGFTHELFTADADSWGAILAIRTGPAELSKSLVTNLLRRGMRCKEGRVWRCVPCCHCQAAPPGKCRACDGTGLEPEGAVPTPTERSFFDLCGVRYLDPEDRR